MVSRRRFLAGSVVLALGGCTDGGDGNGGSTDGPSLAETEPNGSGATREAGAAAATDDRGEIDVASPAFAHGAAIPQRYARDGRDLSPPLTIGSVPEDVRSVALVVDDPDAGEEPFSHWLVWAIMPETRSIPEGLPEGRRLQQLDGAVQGTTDFEELGYGGPMPPRDDGPHRYRFTVHGLSEALEVEPGATRRTVDEALAGNILASGLLVGTYDR